MADQICECVGECICDFLYGKYQPVKGLQGIQGERGERGETGATGRGIQGLRGLRGETGPAGDAVNVDKKFDDVNKRVTEVSNVTDNKIATVNTELTETKETVTTITGEMGNINLRLDGTDDSINILADDIVSFETEITGMTLQIEEIAVNVKKFGAKGDGISDDTQSIKDACNYIQSKGGGKLFFPKGIYNFVGVKSYGDLYHFTDLSYFSLDGVDAILRDVQTYDRHNTETSRLFMFTRCKNINLNNGIKFESQSYDLDINTVYSGIRWFNFRETCESINVDIEVFGGIAVLDFERLPELPLSHKCTGIKANITASYVRYPYASKWSGDNAVVNLKTFTCGRPFFIYGVKDVKIHVVGKNDVSTSLIKSYNGLGCEDIDVYYEDLVSNKITESNVGERIAIHIGDENPTVMRNINIKLNLVNYVGGFGHHVTLNKFIGGGSTPDEIGRGHIVDGLTVSGYSKGIAGINHFTIYRGIFKAPDIVRNLSFKDLIMDAAGGFNVILNDSLDGTMILKNVLLEKHNLNVLNDSGLVLFENCKTLNFTSSSLNSMQHHKYVNCIVLDGATQNYNDNKVFINTKTPIGIVTKEIQTGLSGNPKASMVVKTDIRLGKNIFKINRFASGYYRLSYYLCRATSQTNPTLRSEKFGIKSWTTTVNSSGIITLQSSITDEITERVNNDFLGTLDVSLVTGDNTGAFIKVACTELDGINSVGTFVLEVLSQNGEAIVSPLT